jgi:uncharacterized protein YgiM (DUF1202 family)
VAPEVAYLRDSPGFDGLVLGHLYRGDNVERLDAGEKSPWWRVKIQRSGQVGWVPKEILTSEPVPTVFYYVQEDTAPLLECPRPDCLILEMLFRGDQVQRVEEGGQGWWRVLAMKSRSLGWMPAAALTENLEEARQRRSAPPYFYVAVPKLSLRATPSSRGVVIRTLKFNEQVQKLGEAQNWFKVRQPASGATGWVLSRDLEKLPLVYPRGAPAKEEIKPFKQREEPQMEPEFM